jgi:hypothetical protein
MLKRPLNKILVHIENEFPMNASGIWIGTIVYGKMYRDHAGKEMIFEMKLV